MSAIYVCSLCCAPGKGEKKVRDDAADTSRL